MPTVENFTKQITKGMHRHYGYTVEDFSYIEGISISQGLSKTLDEGTKMVLVFMNLDNDIFNETFENDICSSIGCDRENLVKVLLVSGSSGSIETQNHLNYLISINALQNSFIIIDLASRKIHISDSRMEPIANQIAAVMDENVKRQGNFKNSAVTYSIIGINILVFIISAILSRSIMDINIYVLVFLGAKYNPAIEQGQWYRLFTSMFLHGGLIHIAANMYSLYSIGPLVEHIYGRYRYIVIYLVSGVIASLFSFWFSPYASIGASGAIFGLLGVIFVFAVKERKRIGKGFVRNVTSTVIINLFIGLSLPGIDNFAHLGGLLCGTVLGIAMSLIKK
jgi:rhomboid protease GluP